MAIERRNPLFHCDFCCHVEEMTRRDSATSLVFPDGTLKLVLTEIVDGSPKILHQHLCAACSSRLKGFMDRKLKDRPSTRNRSEEEILNHPAMR